MFIKLRRNTSYWSNLELLDSTGELDKALSSQKKAVVKVQFRVTNQPHELFQGTLEVGKELKLNKRLVYRVR